MAHHIPNTNERLTSRSFNFSFSRNFSFSSHSRSSRSSGNSSGNGSVPNCSPTRMCARLIFTLIAICGSSNILWVHYLAILIPPDNTALTLAPRASSLASLEDFTSWHQNSNTSTSTISTNTPPPNNMQPSVQQAPQRQRLVRPFRNYDKAAPKALPGMSRSHALPNAVPSHRTIPIAHVEDEAYHKEKRKNASDTSLTGDRGRGPVYYTGTPDSGEFNWEHNYQADHRALYLYNPSLVPLMRNTKNNRETNRAFLDLENGTWEALTGKDDSVAYLATFRANTGCNCFGSDKNAVMKAQDQINYLAVGLLDANLDLIDNTDVLIDLNAGPSRGKYWRQFAEDCKVLSMHGHFYFLCNEDLFRVRIVRRYGKETTDENNGTTARHQQGPLLNDTASHTGGDHRNNVPYRYPNIYGNGLEVTLLKYYQKLGAGKNLNIFRVPAAATSRNTRATNDDDSASTTDNSSNSFLDGFDYYLQNFPLPHTYQRLLFSNDGTLMDKPRVAPQQKSFAAIPPPSFDGPDCQHQITTCPENDLPGTWVTNCSQPVTRTFFEGIAEHGTACCVSVELPGQDQPVLVGISHIKTKGNNNPWWTRDIYGRYQPKEGGMTIGHKRYLSRLVAYNMSSSALPQSPDTVLSQHQQAGVAAAAALRSFDVVAQSGLFCLGFAAVDEAGGNPMAGRNREYVFDLFQHGPGQPSQASSPSSLTVSTNITTMNEISSSNSSNDSSKTPSRDWSGSVDCPMVHFATGISEYVGDSSKAVISYGVADCYPRMIVVEKKDIVNKLLGVFEEDDNDEVQ